MLNITVSLQKRVIHFSCHVIVTNSTRSVYYSQEAIGSYKRTAGKLLSLGEKSPKSLVVEKGSEVTVHNEEAANYSERTNAVHSLLKENLIDNKEEPCELTMCLKLTPV